MASPAHDSLVKDMQGMQLLLLEAQKHGLQTETWVATVESQAFLYETRIEQIEMTPPFATRLRELLQGWPAACKHMLEKSIVDSLARAADKTGRRPNQHMRTIYDYFTKGEKEKLRSGLDNKEKVKVLVDRCICLYLTLPSERTMQHIIAVAVSLGVSAETSMEKFEVLQEFKHQLRPRVKHMRAPEGWHVVHFPESPHDLFKELYQHAYPEDPPEFHNGCEESCFLEDVPLRKTSALVRDAKRRRMDEPAVGESQDSVASMDEDSKENLEGGVAPIADDVVGESQDSKENLSEPEASAGGVEEPEDSDENLDGDYFNLLNSK